MSCAALCHGWFCDSCSQVAKIGRLEKHFSSSFSLMNCSLAEWRLRDLLARYDVLCACCEWVSYAYTEICIVNQSASTLVHTLRRKGAEPNSQKMLKTVITVQYRPSRRDDVYIFFCFQFVAICSNISPKILLWDKTVLKVKSPSVRMLNVK